LGSKASLQTADIFIYRLGFFIAFSLLRNVCFLHDSSLFVLLLFVLLHETFIVVCMKCQKINFISVPSSPEHTVSTWCFFLIQC